jgi:hypothetical protein
MGHGRWRRRMALLAADALDGRGRAAAEAHAASCARCAQAQAAFVALRGELASDPIHEAQMPVALGALEARVRERLRDSPGAAHARALVAWPPRLLMPAAAALAVVVAGLALLKEPPAPAPSATPPAIVEDGSAAGGPGDIDTDEMMRRMERTLAREQAARYLAEAQDVLVTVAGGVPPCPKGAPAVEVGDEARRSRELLARRAMLMELGGEEVASARPVMAEVEEMLREVAALPSCVRPGRLHALERHMHERRLLMKIDLMTRELLG